MGEAPATLQLERIGSPERVRAHAWDEIALPGGRRFFRRWEVLGWLGATSFRLRFSFAEGYPEHYIHLRGAAAAAVADFEQSTYRLAAKTPFMTDVDRLVVTARESATAGAQALATFGELARTRLGLGGDGNPYERSIKAAVTGGRVHASSNSLGQLEAQPGRCAEAERLRHQPVL